MNHTVAILSLLFSTSVLAAQAAPEKKAADFIVLASGVKISHTQVGAGKKPTSTSVVKVHYKGTLNNGLVFDSSMSRGQPAVFRLNQVIPCWTQAVATMAIGGKATVVCPANTAYGERGIGPIPPNSELTFKIELIDILGWP